MLSTHKHSARLSLSTLYALIERPDRDSRILALNSASHLRDVCKIDLAAKCFSCGEASLNRYIFRLLSKIKQPPRRPELAPLLRAALGEVAVENILGGDYPVSVRAEAVKILEFLPPPEQAASLRRIFNGTDLPVAREAHKLMALYRAQKLPLDEQTIEKFLALDLRFGLQCVQLADNVATQVALLWRYYRHADPAIRALAGRHIWTVHNYSDSPAIREQIAQRAPALIRYSPRDCPLFKNVPEAFFTASAIGSYREFDKDGSRLLLTGGPRATSEIVREISLPAYRAWHKAFGAVAHWKAAGFDYIPIEPIRAATPLPAGRMRVQCQVLDLPLAHLMSYKNFFERVPALRAQKHRIMSVLKELAIDHGHPHNNNFCVLFSRSQGEVDLTAPARLYLIDFDQARMDCF